MLLFMPSFLAFTGTYQLPVYCVEVWHIWLNGGYYEYDERPIIYRKTLQFHEVIPEDIREIDNAEIWENVNSIRSIHYCLKILGFIK